MIAQGGVINVVAGLNTRFLDTRAENQIDLRAVQRPIRRFPFSGRVQERTNHWEDLRLLFLIDVIYLSEDFSFHSYIFHRVHCSMYFSVVLF
jgi:hypothetical protein